MRVKYPILGDKDWLIKEVQLKPLRQIASEIGSSYGGVIWAVRKFGIKVPQRSKHRVSYRWNTHSPNKGRFGKKAYHWKGGRREASNGRYIYVYAHGHPYETSEGYVMEHRLVMEKKLGRYLTSEELVHHKNGDTKDNRLENLELATKREHAKIHFDAVKENARLKALLDLHHIQY